MQSGIGRTGRPFAAETFGVRPDVLLFAKASRRACRSAASSRRGGVMDRWPTGTHGSTFGGNPVACAAALATLDVLDEDDLYARAAPLGARLLDDLRRDGARSPGRRSRCGAWAS